MANIFLDLPVPAEPGVGASVDTGTLGADRTINVAALDNVGSLAIEVSNDDVEWATLTTFGSSGGTRTIRFASGFMRVRLINKISAVVPASGNCDVGADGIATVVVSIPVPATDGVGAPVDISALPIIKTALVTGSGVAPFPSFNGSVVLETSQDGTDWAGQFSLGAPGGIQTRDFTAQFIRARRILTTNAPAGTVNCTIAGASPSGAGGGGGLAPGVVLDEPQFTDGPTAVASSPTILSGAQTPTSAPGLGAPQGTLYLGDGGQFYLKTGASDTDWESVANDAFFNVRDFGAVGDGVTDDRAAIQNAIDACSAAGGGVVWVPSSGSPYIVTQLGSQPYCLILRSNVEVRGESVGGSTLMQAPGIAASVKLFYTDTNATLFGLTSLTLDGNKSNQSVNEQRHGIFLFEGSSKALIRRCRFQNFTGDGVYFYIDARDSLVTDCVFDGNDRNGITLGANGVRNNVIDACTFENIAVQCVDTEPQLEGDLVTNIIIRGCHFASPGSYAITTAGASARSRNKGFSILGNSFTNGSARVVWCDDVTIMGNVFNVDDAGGYTKAAIEVDRTSRGVAILGNGITHSVAVTFAVAITGTDPLDQPLATVVDGNTFYIDGSAGACQARGSFDVIFTNNTVVGGETPGFGFNARATLNAGSVIVKNNVFRRCTTAITADSAAQDLFQTVLIDGNYIHPDGVSGAIGIALDGALDAIGDLCIGTNYFAPDAVFNVDSVNPTLGPDIVTAPGDWNVSPANSIDIPGHGLSTEDGPFLLSTTGTLPNGQSINTRNTYFAIVLDPNTIQLATSRANALGGTPVPFTTQGTGTHTLRSPGSLIHNFGGDSRDYRTRTGPFRLTTTGTLPGGLALATDYYWVRVGNDEWMFASSYANANPLAPNPVTITDAGVGTHTVTLAGVATQVSLGVRTLFSLLGSTDAGAQLPGLHYTIGAPTHTAANGTIAIRGDGDGALYVRIAGAWIQLATLGAQTFIGAQTGAEVALTDSVGGTVAIDASAANTFTLLATGTANTRQLGLPTNLVVGQEFSVVFTQSAGGGDNELTFNAAYDFGDEGAPTFAGSLSDEKAILTFKVLNATPASEQIAGTTLGGFA